MLSGFAHASDMGLLFPHGFNHETLPINIINNHVYVKTIINGHVYSMIVDTGAHDLLSRRVAKELGLKNEEKYSIYDLNGNHQYIYSTEAKDMRIGRLEMNSPAFLVLNTEQISQSEPFDGIIGYEWLSQVVTTINYRDRKITFTKPDVFLPPQKTSAIPFELYHHIPLIHGYLGHRPVGVTVDTGSTGLISISSSLAKEMDLYNKYPTAPKSSIASTVNGVISGIPIRLDRLEFGSLVLNSPYGEITAVSNNDRDVQRNGNMGGAFLKDKIITFDYKNKHIYIKDESVNSVFNYDKSGLFLVPYHHMIKIYSVADGSAAYTAHITPGDILYSVNNQEVKAKDLINIRSLLVNSAEGVEVSLVVLRNGNAEKINLVLKNRIPDRAN